MMISLHIHREMITTVKLINIAHSKGEIISKQSVEGWQLGFS